MYLLPPDPREWLPPGHLAWAVRAAVAGMDLAPFTAWYRADGQGKKAYHPQLMVMLIMYCYCKGIRSSRAVEMATYDDVGARVLAGNLHPDHATVARFVTRHEAAVRGLLVASLVACAREGLVSVEVVAGDGTKVKANASMAANASAEQLEAEIGELEALLAAEVDTWLEQARAEDAAGDARCGDEGDSGQAGGGPGTLARTAARLIRRQQAKARLEAGKTARQQQGGAERQEKITRLERRVSWPEDGFADRVTEPVVEQVVLRPDSAERRRVDRRLPDDVTRDELPVHVLEVDGEEEVQPARLLGNVAADGERIVELEAVVEVEAREDEVVEPRPGVDLVVVHERRGDRLQHRLREALVCLSIGAGDGFDERIGRKLVDELLDPGHAAAVIEIVRERMEGVIRDVAAGASRAGEQRAPGLDVRDRLGVELWRARGLTGQVLLMERVGR